MSDELTELLRPWLAELVLVAGSAGLLAMARVKSMAARAGDAALLVLAASAVGAVASMDSIARFAASGMLAVDPFAAFFKFLLSMTALATAWLSSRARELEIHGEASPVSWALFLLSVVGMDVMVSSASALAAWTGFATATLASSLAVALRRPDDALAESAALVLLLEGAAACVLLAAGFALVYGLAGTFVYDGIGGRLAVALAAPGGRTALLAAVVLVLAGSFLRMGLVPWERSRVDLAAAGPLSGTAWLLVGPALAALAMLTRFLRGALSAPVAGGAWSGIPGVDWQPVVAVVAIVTMILGNVAAVRETSLRRLVAWLTVSQAGYLAIGLVVGSDEAVEAMLFHSVACALMVFGLIAALAPVVEQAGSDDFEALRGLGRRRGSARAAAAAIAIFVLAFSAVWPLAGYSGRTMLLAELLRSGGTGLAVFAAAASAVGLVVLVRIVATLLDRPQDPDENVTMDFEAVVLAGVLVGGTVGFGLWPGALVAFARRSVVFFGG
jgi:NADH:ubiquinone oxidoreductase subunit 2 (subunit N)